MITKEIVAVQQIDASIRLWCEDIDFFSHYTLVAASINILDDLYSKRSKYEHSMFWSMCPRYWIISVKQSASWFKHADKDPNSQISVDEKPDFIKATALSIVLCKKLCPQLETNRMKAFDLMLKSGWPHLFNIQPDQDHDIENLSRYGTEIIRRNEQEQRMFTKTYLYFLNEQVL